MMDAVTDPTLGSLYGTPVLFFPVPTLWVSSTGCEKYIYRQVNGGTILAWDPVYPDLDSTETGAAESCYPSQQSSWWFQSAGVSPSTALGPTFVCPEAYTHVHSTVLDRSPEAETQYTYCCPPNFTLGAILPPNQRSVFQCTSTAGPGVTISLLSVTFLTSAVTVTGEDGTVTRQPDVRSTNLPTSTVVQFPAATVYAPPVNGLTPGAIAGAVVGAAFGFMLLALGVFFLRQMRQRSAIDRPELETREYETARDNHGSSRGLAVSEMPVYDRPQELPANI
ncbi:hypothetical protein N658DRAFT_499350 [Parathielavia hyrcaniae]|uniref:Uncharacterized protein n=1 Tax=Parathielavia hyrcaniae TaxID=113614 RepID=A0AAN6PVE9_9PEZI|nr:hypothetical protein N658DRAFT_499350 [Parathielavia hyrcaniae]